MATRNKKPSVWGHKVGTPAATSQQPAELAWTAVARGASSRRRVPALPPSLPPSPRKDSDPVGGQAQALPNALPPSHLRPAPQGAPGPWRSSPPLPPPVQRHLTAPVALARAVPVNGNRVMQGGDRAAPATSAGYSQLWGFSHWPTLATAVPGPHHQQWGRWLHSLTSATQEESCRPREQH